MPARAMPALTDDVLSWARWYGEMGWPIFPCHTPSAAGCSCRDKDACDSPGKHPRITGWQNAPRRIRIRFTSGGARCFPTPILGWRRATPAGCSMWIPLKGGALALQALIDVHGSLPETPLGHTGGSGFHHHFQLPITGTIGNKVGFAPGLDARALGGLIIVPPSSMPVDGPICGIVSMISKLPHWPLPPTGS